MADSDIKIDFNSMLRICKRYSAMGSMVQEQLDNFMGEGPEGLNPNALKMIREFVKFAESRGVDVETHIDLEELEAFQ